MKTRVNQEKLLDEIATNRSFRKELAMADINWFFTIYFSNYIKYESAPFHREMFSLITNEQNPIVAITAFRSSAKSTICSLVFPIWAIVGPLRKKNIVIVTLNQTRSEETLNNIKYEFETNDLLIEDFNPWQGKTNKWTENAIVIPKYDAMIKAVSVSEGIRGIRYKQHRPEIIICEISEFYISEISENILFFYFISSIFTKLIWSFLTCGRPATITTRSLFLSNLFFIFTRFWLGFFRFRRFLNRFCRFLFLGWLFFDNFSIHNLGFFVF